MLYPRLSFVLGLGLGLIWAAGPLAGPLNAQEIITEGPFQVGDYVLHNGVLERVIAVPAMPGHAVPSSSELPHGHTVLPHQAVGSDSALQPIVVGSPEVVYPLEVVPSPIPMASSPASGMDPSVVDDDDEPHDCLQPGSDSWNRMVELIRENARLEAAIEKVEAIGELREEVHQDRMASLEQTLEQASKELASMRAESRQVMVKAEVEQQLAIQLQQTLRDDKAALRQREERLTKAEQQATAKMKSLQQKLEQMAQASAEQRSAAEKKKQAEMQSLANAAAEKIGAANERIEALEKELAKTKHHLDDARQREASLQKERKALQEALKNGKKNRNRD